MLNFLRANLKDLDLESLDVYEGSFTNLKGSFSVIISNPPFFDQLEGRLSPRKERNLSKFFLQDSLKDLFRTANRLQEVENVFFLSGHSSKIDFYNKTANDFGYGLEIQKNKNKVFLSMFKKQFSI